MKQQLYLSFFLALSVSIQAKPAVEFVVEHGGFKVPMCIEYLGTSPNPFTAEIDRALQEKMHTKGQVVDSCTSKTYLGECKNMQAKDFFPDTSLRINLRWGALSDSGSLPIMDKLMVDKNPEDCQKWGGKWEYPPLDSIAIRGLIQTFQQASKEKNIELLKPYFETVMSQFSEDQSEQLCKRYLPKELRELGGLSSSFVFETCGPKIWFSDPWSSAIQNLEWQNQGTLLAKNTKYTGAGLELHYFPESAELRLISKTKAMEVQLKFRVFHGHKIYFQSALVKKSKK